MGSYIVDFYCPAAKLVIELDGNHHRELAQTAYDLERSKYLNAIGMYVLHFSNDEINMHMDYVCNIIRETVRKRILESP